MRLRRLQARHRLGWPLRGRPRRRLAPYKPIIKKVTKMITVKVNTALSYDVLVGKGLLDGCGEMIKKIMPCAKAAVVTDSNVAPLYLDRVTKSLERAGYKTDSFVFEAGEESKNICTLSDLLEFLAQREYTRSDLLVALGGGVTGDLTGFAAAVYLRGMEFVQIPTTLLAAVDSSVGGKTAVDLKAGKNLAGAFKQPKAVVMDTDTLDTLPDEEFSNGMAEVIKYGILFDRELFEMCLNPKKDVEGLISQCVTHKARVVEHDEFDRGERKLLNLGHTIGHAIEKASEFSVPHGAAVAIGTAMISRAGEKLGYTEKGTADTVVKMLKENSLPTECEYAPELLAEIALSDKKRDGQKISLIIPKRIGECFISDQPIEKLSDYVEAGMK